VRCNFLNVDENSTLLGDLGRAILFNGTGIGRAFALHNIMESSLRGISIEDQATIGDQFGAKWASSNEWDPDNVNPLTDFTQGHTFAWNADGANTTFYVDQSGLPMEPVTNGINSATACTTDVDITADTYDCDIMAWDGPQQPGVFTKMRETGKDIIEDSVSIFIFEQSTKYLNKLWLYETIKEFPDSMAIDTLFQNFEALLDTSNVGRFYRYSQIVGGGFITTLFTLPDTVFGARDSLESLTNQFSIDTTMLNEAEDILDSINPINKVEVCNKAVQTVILASLIREYDLSQIVSTAPGMPRPIFGQNLNSAEKDTLEKYALLCPNEYGPAVYIARGLLAMQEDTAYSYFSIYVSDCDSIGAYARFANSISENSKRVINIYPNPSTGELFLDIGEYSGDICAELITCNGLKLGIYKLKQRITEINIGENANGLYIIRILDTNGKTIETKRIALIR
jgi:hypothetical protein